MKGEAAPSRTHAMKDAAVVSVLTAQKELHTAEITKQPQGLGFEQNPSQPPKQTIRVLPALQGYDRHRPGIMNATRTPRRELNVEKSRVSVRCRCRRVCGAQVSVQIDRHS
jgi:hypothetical protein